MKTIKEDLITSFRAIFVLVAILGTFSLLADTLPPTVAPSAATTPADGKAPPPTVAELQTKLDAANQEIEGLKAQMRTQGTTIQVLMEQRAKLANDLLNTEIGARIAAQPKKAP